MSKAKQQKKAAQVWPRPGTMGAVIVAQIMKGKSTEQVIATVRAKWSRAKASLTAGGIGWWRQAMKDRGLKLPAARPAKAAKKVMRRAAKKAAGEAGAAPATQRRAA